MLRRAHLLLGSLFLLAPRGDDPPAEVATWLAQTATPLASLERGAEATGFGALKTIVGEARIVGLGEATHGSHEFFAFKARALEYLVRELGFTDFAMETGFVAALDTNAWVERGEGDLASALTGLAGLWRTEEYRELLEWLRAWNADPAHARKVRIHGLDMQVHSGEAAAALRAYLERVDAEVAAGLAPLLADLGNLAAVEEGDQQGLLSVFDELREPFVAKSSEREWAEARQTAVVLVQRWQSTRKSGNEASSFRDRCMADNARWILRQHPGSRLVLSAHNGHVSKSGIFELPGYGVIQSLGRALTQDRAAAGDEDLSMVVIGSAIGAGSFYAVPASGGANRVFEIERAQEGGHEAALFAVLQQPALLDLRAAPAGAVRVWLDTPRAHTGVGGNWDPAWLTQAGYSKLTPLTAEYDALFFVPHATPARLLTPPK